MRTVQCYAVGALSGVGECYGSLVPAAFDSAASVPLSLEWTSAATGDQIALASFGTVATQRRPTWSAGGWDLGDADALVYVDAGKAVAFGAELPYEDVFIPPSASDGRGAFEVSIHMKTHTGGATEAARQVDVGKFKLVFPADACDAVTDAAIAYKNPEFATWEEVTGLGAGAYGQTFFGGKVSGAAVPMLSLTMRCAAGTHAIGVETMEHADSDGVSGAPNIEYASSVGRGDTYVARAEVLVKATTQHVGVFAYASDGRAYVNDFTSLGQPAPSLTVQLDSISDSPDESVHRNVGCAAADASATPPLDSCAYTPPSPAAAGVAVDTRTVGSSGGAATDAIAIEFRSPRTVTLTVADATLSAIGCAGGGSYQSTTLRLAADGDLDVTRLSSYTSNDTSVAVLRDDGYTVRVLGVGPGSATISAYGNVASVAVTVEEAVVTPELVARVVTSLDAAGAAQSFTSEADVGYLYVYARYANGDAHMLDDAELSVEVLAPDTLAYSLTSDGRHRLSIVPDALAASCYDDLLSVQLVACNGSLPAVAPPLELDLPSPVALRALGLSAEVLAPSGSFARSGGHHLVGVRADERGQRQGHAWRRSRDAHLVRTGLRCGGCRPHGIDALLGGRGRRLHIGQSHRHLHPWRVARERNRHRVHCAAQEI